MRLSHLSIATKLYAICALLATLTIALAVIAAWNGHRHAALISEFARYNNGIMGSDKFMDAAFANAPEIKAPAGSPVPEFVPPCPKNVNDMYNKIWTSLLK